MGVKTPAKDFLNYGMQLSCQVKLAATEVFQEGKEVIIFTERGCCLVSSRATRR